MAGVTMRKVQETKLSEVFTLYLASVAARGVKDKTLKTYEQHFNAISKRLDACIDVFQNKNVTVIISVGKNFDIAKLGELPESFIVKNRIPQITVLKQASLFITHGGLNSVSEAMIHGVPMPVIPFVSDQPVNARQVEKLGLGKVLDYQATRQPS